VLGELTADGARLLAAQVQRHVLLGAEGGAQLGLLVLVVHRQHAGNRLAHHADLAQLGGGAANDLGNAQLGELLLVVVELTEQLSLALGAELVRLDLDCTASYIHNGQLFCLSVAIGAAVASEGTGSVLKGPESSNLQFNALRRWV
jgi:hypothetical protein